MTSLRVAVAHVSLFVRAHVCSTEASCSFMGPRWLIYPILSYQEICRYGKRVKLFRNPLDLETKVETHMYAEARCYHRVTTTNSTI
jgi:hypothetical protein